MLLNRYSHGLNALKEDNKLKQPYMVLERLTDWKEDQLLNVTKNSSQFVPSAWLMECVKFVLHLLGMNVKIVFMSQIWLNKFGISLPTFKI